MPTISLLFNVKDPTRKGVGQIVGAVDGRVVNDSSSANKSNDFDSVARLQRDAFTLVVGYKSLIHFHGARNIDRTKAQNRLCNRARLFQNFRFSIDCDLHLLRKISAVSNQVTASFFRTFSMIAICAFFALGCSREGDDTSTPQKALDAIQRMIEEGRPQDLPKMVEIKARDVTFEDGVTEASAIQNVKDKMGDMLEQLWRVSKKVNSRFPAELKAEAKVGADTAASRGFDYRSLAKRVLGDPFGFLTEQRARMEVEDLGDGTAAITIDDEPAFGGLLTMVETPDGWRMNVPVDTLRSNKYWPDTRHEWAVIASMMLGIENSLGEFEEEFDEGKIRSVREAGERVGRLVGESVVVQSVIYSMMKRNDGAAPAKN